MSKLSVELKAAFETYDTNGDGVISRDELKNLLVGTLGEDEDSEVYEDMLTIADADCCEDGKVNFEQFCKSMEEEMEWVTHITERLWLFMRMV